MWRTARRLRAPLARAGIGQRSANYLLISWRGFASVAAVAVILWALEFGSGRNDLGAAFGDIGLNLRPPADQLAALSLLLFLVCYAINLGFSLLRRAVGVRPKLATVNMPPQTVWETIVFALLLSPMAGVSEEIVFRGLFQWAFSKWTGDPISAVASQAVLFGILHMYQGGLGVLRTFALGLVLGAGTLASGSLVPAIIAHTLIDIAVAFVRPPVAARL